MLGLGFTARKELSNQFYHLDEGHSLAAIDEDPGGPVPIQRLVVWRKDLAFELEASAGPGPTSVVAPRVEARV